MWIADEFEVNYVLENVSVWRMKVQLTFYTDEEKIVVYGVQCVKFCLLGNRHKC